MKGFWILLVVLLLSGPALAQHSVVLKNGDKVKGVVMELKEDVLYVAVNREMRKIPLIEVSSIFFNEYVPYDGSFTDSTPEKTIKSGKYLIKYQLKDREMVQAPKVSIGTEDKGTVVVKIKVGRTGTVFFAEPGQPGSTTSSEYLYTKAKFAAMGARFNPHPKGPIETEGTITITY